MRLPEVITEEKIIPVARGLNASTAPALVAALEAGGINSIEITVEGEGGVPAIAAVAGGSTVVAAGTVVTIEQAARAVEAGAQFLVSPHLDAKLLNWAGDRSIPLIPGALTPTEVATAWQNDPPAVKVFPANVGGPAYIRSLLGPYPDLVLIPTGGVTSENIVDYLDAGAAAVGVGGWLTGPDDHSEVTRRTRLLVERIG